MVKVNKELEEGKLRNNRSSKDNDSQQGSKHIILPDKESYPRKRSTRKGSKSLPLSLNRKEGPHRGRQRPRHHGQKETTPCIAQCSAGSLFV